MILTPMAFFQPLISDLSESHELIECPPSMCKEQLWNIHELVYQTSYLKYMLSNDEAIYALIRVIR